MNEILDILNFLTDAYPRQEIREGTIRVYLEILRDVNPHLLRRSAIEHVKKSKWFPSANELLDGALSLEPSRRYRDVY